jgi:hypothetical protein
VFRREAHRAVLAVLQTLDAELFERHHALFGGATRLVLDLGEYRESQDIDFLCSDSQGYAELRVRARRGGPAALFRRPDLSPIELPRELRADQYGIRFPVSVEGRSLKFEIVWEARLKLGAGVRPDWSPVVCLSLEDSFAEKLLANADRWADEQVLARDVIDLSALRRRVGPIPREAWAAAEAAYGKSVREDLRKALGRYLGDAGFQDRCRRGLNSEAPGEILQGARELLADLST